MIVHGGFFFPPYKDALKRSNVLLLFINCEHFLKILNFNSDTCITGPYVYPQTFEIIFLTPLYLREKSLVLVTPDACQFSFY